jgi:hypothetical protein
LPELESDGNGIEARPKKSSSGFVLRKNSGRNSRSSLTLGNTPFVQKRYIALSKSLVPELHFSLIAAQNLSLDRPLTANARLPTLLALKRV